DECVRCHTDCATCDGPGFDDCIECRQKKAVRRNGERKDATGHCVWFRQCSLQSYVDQNGDCQQCHKLCHRCSGPGKDHCLGCNEPYFLMNNTCVQECPVGYYADKDVRVCARCHFSCQSCVGRHSVECLACKAGFFKQGSNCVETYILSHFQSLWKCWGHSNRNCLSCREGYVYLKQQGQCLQRCPPGYYLGSQSTTCHKCHPTCKTCSGKGSLSWLVSFFVRFPYC
uniref:Uncharacterized protein n=1 Tax=Stegastes partitus TaxID=144197 RepID=A0A3B4Z825_9TELE